MVDNTTFSEQLTEYMKDSATPIEELAHVFGVSIRTLLYWRVGDRYPHPRNLWPLRDVPDKDLRDIIREELDRQLPGVFE